MINCSVRRRGGKMGKEHTLDFRCGSVLAIKDRTLPGNVEVGLDSHVGGRDGKGSN